MTSSHNYLKKIRFIFITFFAFLIFSTVLLAANDIPFESVKTQKITVSSGKSIVIRSEAPIKRVSIANPDIADFILLSPQEIYIIAKAAGITNLTLWQDKDIAAIYDLVVGYDIAELKRQLLE